MEGLGLTWDGRFGRNHPSTDRALLLILYETVRTMIDFLKEDICAAVSSKMKPSVHKDRTGGANRSQRRCRKISE